MADTRVDADGTPLLTYREAAARVHRSIRTLWRWRKNGLPMGWGIRDGQRVRLVREDVLLSYWRERLMADPVHLLRIRRKQEGGSPIGAITINAPQSGNGIGF